LNFRSCQPNFQGWLFRLPEEGKPIEGGQSSGGSILSDFLCGLDASVVRLSITFKTYQLLSSLHLVFLRTPSAFHLEKQKRLLSILLILSILSDKVFWIQFWQDLQGLPEHFPVSCLRPDKASPPACKSSGLEAAPEGWNRERDASRG